MASAVVNHFFLGEGAKWPALYPRWPDTARRPSRHAGFELGDQTVAVKCRHRHLRPTASVGFDPGHAALIERAFTHLTDQAHPLDDVAAGAPQIHGLPAWADAIGEFNDRDAITTLVQPEGKCGPRDSGSADQDGRRCHERKGSR